MKDLVLAQIEEIAIKYKVQKVVLFGSRARGDNSPLSDYDIAVFDDHLSSIDKALFYTDIDEIETLKSIDIIFMDENSRDELMENINSEGVIIYEQARKEVK